MIIPSSDLNITINKVRRGERLMYTEHERGVKIQHAANSGEVTFGKYNV